MPWSFATFLYLKIVFLSHWDPRASATVINVSAEQNYIFNKLRSVSQKTREVSSYFFWIRRRFPPPMTRIFKAWRDTFLFYFIYLFIIIVFVFITIQETFTSTFNLIWISFHFSFGRTEHFATDFSCKNLSNTQHHDTYIRQHSSSMFRKKKLKNMKKNI